jgi:tetratricopeptide (TPR) repeat protein
MVTPLQYAAYLGEEQLAKDLVGLGADVQATDRDGWTALHWAVIKRDLLRIHLDKYHIAQMLLEKGANAEQASTAAKLLPHTDAYLPKRIPAGANAYDLLAYALPKDADMAELLEAAKPGSSLKAANYLENGIELAAMSAHQAALLEYNKALQLDPQLAEAYYRRALSKSMLSMYQEVERDLNAAIKLQPVYPEAFLARAKAKIELDRYAAAEEDVNMAIKQGIDVGEGHYWRGKVRIRLGKREEACQDFQSSAKAGYKDGLGAIKLYCK